MRKDMISSRLVEEKIERIIDGIEKSKSEDQEEEKEIKGCIWPFFMMG